jgi:hypothetical protein
MADDIRNVIKDLALDGSGHFPASYVAKKSGLSVSEAKRELETLRRSKVVEVHFDVVNPHTDRTIKSYRLKQEVPIGKPFDDPTGDSEPFELTENDILVTYSPTSDFLLKLNRSGDSKKKSSPLRKLRGTIDSLRTMATTALRLRNNATRSSSSTAQAPSSTAQAPRSHRRKMAAQ